jgi:hypothetical protein
MTEREQPPTDVGAGYPEDGPPGSGMDPQEHAENEAAPADARQEREQRDGDPGQAAGNPRAAGADDDAD